MTRLPTNVERDGLGFTPGPWRFDPSGQVRGSGVVMYWINDRTSVGTEVEADARLIAAAPDMLEELEQQADGSATIAALLKGQQSAVAASLIGMLNLQEQAARAMIAKARGRA